MKDRAPGEVSPEDLGRLERRADALRERVAARGGTSAQTSADAAELESIEAAIAAAEALRWRRFVDEPIPAEETHIVVASILNQDEYAMATMRRTGSAAWTCTCGCRKTVEEDRFYRWRPLRSNDELKAADRKELVSPTAYRGRQRLAIIDDRIKYLAVRMKDLKEKGKPARFEKDEIEALEWIRELATRAARNEKT